MRIPSRPQASFGRPKKSKMIGKVKTKVSGLPMVKNLNARSRQLRRKGV